jgi:hypothetical protein
MYETAAPITTSPSTRPRVPNITPAPTFIYWYYELLTCAHVSNVDLAELIVPRRPLFLRAAAYMRLLLGALSLLMLLASGTSSSWVPQPVPISKRWANALATAKESVDTGRGYAEVYLNLSKQFAMLTESPVTAWSGGVYDCWTDVETECDGFLSYDRVLKVPVAPMRAANALLTGDDDA